MSTDAVVAAATAAATTSAAQSPSTPAAPTVFEFTKRKKWAEILITELSGCICLVLAPSGNILFCTRSVRDLLGWKETDLVDAPVIDYVHEDDQSNLLWQIEDTLNGSHTLDLTVRMRSNLQPSDADVTQQAPQWSQFDLLAYPHTPARADKPTCLVVSARPHPSRFSQVYQAMLDLKLENEYLTQRLHDLQQGAASPVQDAQLAPATPVLLEPHAHYATAAAGVAGTYGALSGFDFGDFSAAPAPAVVPMPVAAAFSVAPGAGEDDDEPRKKRPRPTKQLVCATCGRTDSPEWRKGPQGPKTLCNACGLRYAKQRKTEGDAT